MYSPLLVNFDCWFGADFEAVSATDTFAIIGDFGWMVTISIDPIGQNQDIYRADFIATKATTLANFLQNFDLRH